MLKNIAIALLIVGFVLLSLAKSQDAARLPAGRLPDVQTGRLTGYVVDRFDARIVDASVCVAGANKYKRCARTNGDGRFDLKLPAGIYDIKVEHVGFKNFVFDAFQVNAGVAELVNIHLEIDVRYDRAL